MIDDYLLFGTVVIAILLFVIALLDYLVLAHSKTPIFWRLCPMPNWKFRPQDYNYNRHVIIVTGGNEGIGKETALQLLKTGAYIIIGCRNESRSLAVMDELEKETGYTNIRYIPLDLSSFSSIKQFAHDVKDFLSKIEKEPQPRWLYALINNAGVMLLPKKVLSPDGIEMTFAVNYFGPFLLTHLLTPSLRDGSLHLKCPTRIINVSSRAHLIGPTKVDITNLKSELYFDRFGVYGNSKLALIMFTRELARKLKSNSQSDKMDSNPYPTVVCCSLHPGTVDTTLFKYVPQPVRWIVTKFFAVSPKEGAMTTLFCTVSDTIPSNSGAYFSECALAKESSKALNTELAQKLWDISERVCGIDATNKII